MPAQQADFTACDWGLEQALMYGKFPDGPSFFDEKLGANPLTRFSDPCETRCHGKHGYCSIREGHNHFQLDGGGNTRRAQRYPGGLNFALAAVLIRGGRGRFPKGYIADVFGGSGGVAKAAISSGFPSYVFDNAVRIKDDITHRSFTAWLKKRLTRER